MNNLISFEIKKFFHRKKNLITLVLFAVLIIGFVSINRNLENSYKKSEIESIDYRISSLNKEIPETKNLLKEYPNLLHY